MQRETTHDVDGDPEDMWYINDTYWCVKYDNARGIYGWYINLIDTWWGIWHVTYDMVFDLHRGFALKYTRLIMWQGVWIASGHQTNNPWNWPRVPRSKMIQCKLPEVPTLANDGRKLYKTQEHIRTVDVNVNSNVTVNGRIYIYIYR